MKISQQGLDLIKHFEGLRLKAYVCPAGKWTIGYGHTGSARAGMVIDEYQAEQLLRQDLEWAERAVNKHVTVPLGQGQFDSLVSFTFNLGEGAFMKSTLLKLLNKGLYAAAGREFSRWVHAGGKRLKGLVRRREAEQELFMEPDSEPPKERQVPEGPQPSGSIFGFFRRLFQ